MNGSVLHKTLSVEIINPETIQDDPILSEKVDQARAMYGENIVLALLSPVNTDDELVFRPDMAKFLVDTSVQEMKISTVGALKDVFVADHTLLVDGGCRDHREPGSKTFYFITDGRILAINPMKKSLESFLGKKRA